MLVDVTATHLPRENDESREIRAADFDGDGDLDLVVGNVRFVLDEPERDTLLLNDGKGVFTPAPAGSLPPAGGSPATSRSRSSISMATRTSTSSRRARCSSERPATTACCSTTAQARFSVAARGAVLPPSAEGNGFDVEVADFDADGRADLFLCNRASFGNDPERSGGLQRLLLRRER